MRKGMILLAVLVLGLLTSLFIGIHIVRAGEIGMSIGPELFQTTFVDQPVNITAHPLSGTPPYTYQWYTQFWTSIWGSPDGDIVAFPNATSSTFQFIESTPGTYDISLQVNDSAGNGDYDSFPISGVWVVVKALPTPSPSPSPTPAPPNISFLSLQNKSYTVNSIPLNFTLSKPAEWIGYSLDRQGNITINGNTTLTDLPNGPHTLTIYANDTNGNTAAPQTITFIIAKPEPFPTVTVAAVSGVAIVILVAGLLVYFKKRKQKG